MMEINSSGCKLLVDVVKRDTEIDAMGPFKLETINTNAVQFIQKPTFGPNSPISMTRQLMSKAEDRSKSL